MNNTYCAYTLADGQFTGLIISVPAAELSANTPTGCGLLAGVFDPQRWRVDIATGQAVELLPEKPADTDHVTWAWDANLSRYLPTMTLQGARANVMGTVTAALASIDQTSGTDRAVRELLLASGISAQAQTRIAAIEARAAAVRALAARCMQATTVDEVDAIGLQLQALQVVQVTA